MFQKINVSEADESKFASCNICSTIQSIHKSYIIIDMLTDVAIQDANDQSVYCLCDSASIIALLIGNDINRNEQTRFMKLPIVNSEMHTEWKHSDITVIYLQ